MAISTKKFRYFRIGLFAGVASIALAGCNSSDKGGVSSSSNAAGSATPITAFGSGFATKFAAPANSEPADPTASDIIPLSLTDDPKDVL